MSHAAVALQRRCACGGTPGVDGECARCKAKRLARARRRAQDVAPGIVHDVLRSAGHPLEPAVRAHMEGDLGHDFSRVRIHRDDRAARSARAVGADAYTVGADVVFNADRYRPATPEGSRLLAHELAHVVQQAEATRAAGTDIPILPQGSGAEREASSINRRRPQGSAVTQLRTPTSLARQEARPAGGRGDDLPYEKWSPDLEEMYRSVGEYEAADALRECRIALAGGRERAGGWACERVLTADDVYRMWVVFEEGGDPETEHRSGVAAGTVAAKRLPTAPTGPASPARAAPARHLRSVPMTPKAPPVPTAAPAPPASTGPTLRGALRVGGRVAARAALPVTAGLIVIDAVKYAWFQSILVDLGYIILVPPRSICMGRCHQARPELPRPLPRIPFDPPTLRPDDVLDWTRRRIPDWPKEEEPETGERPAPRPVPIPEQPSEPRRRSHAYPICWAVQLGPPSRTDFVRVKSERDELMGKQARMQLEWRARHEDFNARDFHVHHVTPLFLGGVDNLQTNGTVIPKGSHLRGHRVLRYQPQLASPPPPLRPMPVDLYAHPPGIRYLFVGFKERADEVCGDQSPSDTLRASGGR